MFLIVFVVGALNALRETPDYQARTQLLIEKDTPNVARLDQMFQSQDGWYNDDFYQTQYRILQSRSLAKTDHRRDEAVECAALGNGPDRRCVSGQSSLAGRASEARLGEKPIVGEDAPARRRRPRPEDETRCSRRTIDEFLGGARAIDAGPQQPAGGNYVTRPPIRCSPPSGERLAKAYIAAEHGVQVQRVEGRGRLARRLTEQRRAVEASEAALQALPGEERRGVGRRQRLEHRRPAPDRSQRRADQGQDRTHQQGSALQPAEGRRRIGHARHVPGGARQRYIQKLEADLSDLQRQQAQLAERYGERHAEMIKIRTAIETAEPS